MTRYQFACIMQAKEKMKEIRRLAIIGQDACGNDDTEYYCLSDIEYICDRFIDDFDDVDPSWKRG